MTQGRNLKRSDSPTIQQLEYLLQLEEVAGRRGCVKMVAERCGVNHGSVSRYFKVCYEKGFLTEKHEYTVEGKRYLNGYKGILKILPKYLKMIGIEEDKINQEVTSMIENMEWETLIAIISHGKKMKTFMSKSLRK